MGWLEADVLVSLAESMGKFQFHYGMIGRLIDLNKNKRLLKFQFHYGMIGSHQQTFRKFLAQPCFNSTMGWLEGGKEMRIYTNLQGFNSTMGWLEDRQGVANHMGIGVSIPLWDDWKIHAANGNHYGAKVSIPLWDDWKNGKVQSMASVGRSFNSTMGWLEAFRLLN